MSDVCPKGLAEKLQRLRGGSPPPEPKPVQDESPPVPSPPPPPKGDQTGDEVMEWYYEDEHFRIANCDCRDVKLPQVDLVLTDPPYGVVNRDDNGLRKLDKDDADVVTMTNFEIATLAASYGKVVYLWCGTEQVSEYRATLVQLGLSTRIGVWEKSNPSPMNGQYIWLSGLEVCVYGKKRGGYHAPHCKNPIWRGPTQRKEFHPTQKPVWLMEELIEASCPPGGVVLDPFMGSGTTLLAARNVGRKAIGVELKKEYCDGTIERLK